MKPITSRAAFKARLTAELGFTAASLQKGQGHVVRTYHKPITSQSCQDGYAVLEFDSGNGTLQMWVGARLKELLNKVIYQYVVEDNGSLGLDSLSDNLLTIEIKDDETADSKGITNTQKYEQVKEFLQKLEQDGYFAFTLDELYRNYQAGLKIKTQIVNKVHQELPEFRNIIDEYDTKDTIWFYPEPTKGNKTVPAINFRPKVWDENKQEVTITIGKARLKDDELVASSKYWGEDYFYGSFNRLDTLPNQDARGQVEGSYWKPENLDLAITALKNHFKRGLKKV